MSNKSQLDIENRHIATIFFKWTKFNNISGDKTQSTKNEYDGPRKTGLKNKQFGLQIGARCVTKGCGKTPVNEVYGNEREIQQCN